MQDTIIGISVVIGSSLIIFVVGKLIERLTGLPIWGDPFWGNGRIPKP